MKRVTDIAERVPFALVDSRESLECNDAGQRVRLAMGQGDGMMKKRFTPVLISVLVFQLTVGFSLVGFTQEPEDPIDSSNGFTPEPDPYQTSNSPVFSQQALDQMLAPIALYPDALLAQILMAATYPLEVVEAARWS